MSYELINNNVLWIYELWIYDLWIYELWIYELMNNKWSVLLIKYLYFVEETPLSLFFNNGLLYVRLHPSLSSVSVGFSRSLLRSADTRLFHVLVGLPGGHLPSLFKSQIWPSHFCPFSVGTQTSTALVITEPCSVLSVLTLSSSNLHPSCHLSPCLRQLYSKEYILPAFECLRSLNLA